MSDIGYLIDSGSSGFQTRQAELKAAGWRVEWNGDGNVCYAPDGSEAFIYGTTPEEDDGAWAYLMSVYLNQERQP